ncbi:hypothetical protein ACFSUS_19155 [Spirosoma soli]|uniref:Uncharacterized protein n=1 Tax=Spirosoma soli TaxID=1770529 RepID=A0ABW5MAZ8_9BACT
MKERNPPQEPCSLSTGCWKLKPGIDKHPTPTGVDGGRETQLNKRTCNLYTPVWLG